LSRTPGRRVFFIFSLACRQPTVKRNDRLSESLASFTKQAIDEYIACSRNRFQEIVFKRRVGNV
jgi:hypothetical protein